MIQALKRIFAAADLKQKILFTLAMLFICRIGAYVPVPGINGDEVVKVFQFATGGGQNLFQLMDIFTGGAFAKMTLIALGVMPYIQASILMQLIMAIIPSVQREVKESPDQGKRKIGKWTRILTLVFALMQSFIFARQAVSMNYATSGIIYDHIWQVQMAGVPYLFYMLVMATMTAGTLFLMWVGEQISEKGIGNGISMIITVGILASLPSIIGNIIGQMNLDSQEPGQITFSSLVVLCSVFVMIIVGTILVIQGTRKIPLQYARRTLASEDASAANSAHIPLKINYAGVIPVIFASSVLMFPATIAQFFGKNTFFSSMATMLTPGNWVYMTLFVALIMFFTYFWTVTQFHPEQIASDMKKSGAFIPGVRQGAPTQEYLESCMNKITFVGAVFLALIAILPALVSRFLSVDQSISQFFGGTSLLILVGVVLDTTKQIESHLIMNRYDGFMTRKKAKARL